MKSKCRPVVALELDIELVVDAIVAKLRPILEGKAKGMASKSGTPFNKLVVQRMLAVTWPDVERGIVAYEKRNVVS
jgi:hypothetical protein